MIYLDNAATTKPSNEFISYFQDNLENNFYNPSAPYEKGIETLNKIEESKKILCDFLKLPFNDNVIFTGSATEANNIAILGSLRKNFKHLVFSEGEHSSVYNVAIELKNKGYNVDFVPLQKSGQIDYNLLSKILTKDTDFLSCMLVNNETGAINDINKILEIKNKICPKAIFHSDIVQGFGKIKECQSLQDVDIITFSAHKIYGNKGLGVLYAKNIKKLKPIQFGGGQEYNLRSGTQNVPSILSFSTYIKDFNIDENYNYILKLKNQFLNNILSNEITLNSNNNNSPYILSLRFYGVRGETLLNACSSKGVIIGRGSACSSKKVGNRILQSMGYNNDEIIQSVRISFSKYNTIEEINTASKIILDTYKELKVKLGLK